MSQSTDPTNWKLIIDVSQFAISIAIGLFLWVTNKDKVTNKRISDFEEHNDIRFDKQADRLTKVETTLDHRPQDIDLINIHKRLDAMQKGQSEQAGELKGMNKTLDLIHKSLLDK